MKSKKEILLVGLILLSAFLLRIKLFEYRTHWPDMFFWQNWGEKIAGQGAINFYKITNSDYLPFYPLILGLVYSTSGFIKNFFPAPDYFFYKMPPAIGDIFLGLFIYKILRKKSPGFALLAMILFVFNPAVIYNSSLWGQVDVIGTLFAFLALYFFTKKKYLFAGVGLGVALVTKPLYLTCLPIFILAIFLQWKNSDKEIFLLVKRELVFVITSTAVVWVVCWPFVFSSFSLNIGLVWEPFILLVNRYKLIANGYQFSTVNAFNFWAMTDKGFWLSDSRRFGIFTYYSLGNLINSFFIFIIIVRFFFVKKKELFYKMSLAFALIFLSSFIFLTRMHERHLFYFLPFLLVASFFRRRLLAAYFVLSLIYLLNLHFALECSYHNNRYIFSWTMIRIFSFVNLTVFFWILAEFFYPPGKLPGLYEKNK